MIPDKQPKRCNLCGGKVVYVPNKLIYGKSYGSGFCYMCTKCKAYVGTHEPRPMEAMGLLANKEMRNLKQICHDLFDEKWKTHNERRYMYHKLADKMGITMPECHFGYFDADQLKQALKILMEGDL